MKGKTEKLYRLARLRNPNAELAQREIDARIARRSHNDTRSMSVIASFACERRERRRTRKR